MKKTIALTWGILGAVTGAYADQTVQTKSIPAAPTTVLKTDVSQSAIAAASLPQQPTVISGQAAITTQGQKMTITPNQQNTLINWNSFNIAANHHVHHNHASSAHTTVHNVTGGAPSTLAGTLSANQGNVFLVNSGGIVVTKGAHIDMGNQGKFVASTYTLKNPGNFTSGGQLQFADNPDAKCIKITGDFTFSGAGLAFIAPGIDQMGAIIGLASPVSNRDDALDISFFDDRFQLRLEGKTAQTIKDQKVQNDVTIRSILAKNSKQGAHALTAEQVSEGFTAMNPVHTNADAQQIEQNAAGDVWLIGAPNGGQVNVNNDIHLKGGTDAAAGKAIILGDEVNLNTGTFDLSADHTAGQLFVGVKPTYQRLNQY
ncbi:MAG: hypothetical protein C0582_03450 [Alphaproteobacteria bacterium]|nr:MAG: hypothetical protein C0582_03450 [Alphaproteobacteria bacterium]